MSASASYGNSSGSRSYVGLGWAIGIHGLLLFLMLSGIFQTTVNHLLKPPVEPVVLQEVELPPLPVVQSKPQPMDNKLAAPLPTPVVTPTIAAPVESPIAQEAPAKAERSVEPALVAHAAAAEPTHKAANTASAEMEFAARLRNLINASKRYPTGRQASQQRPQGVVKLWFSLSRNGSLIDAGILEFADSNLLNDAALSTVRRTTYPAFSADLWPGQDQHRFTVDIEFLPPS